MREPTLALARGVWVPGMPVGDFLGGTPAALAARDLGGAFLARQMYIPVAAECFTHPKIPSCLSRGSGGGTPPVAAECF